MRFLTPWRILVGLLLVAIPYALVRTTDGGARTSCCSLSSRWSA
jgi:hypothetical protein